MNSYITATGNIILESGSIEEFNAPVIFVTSQFEPRQEKWTVTIGISTGVVSASSPVTRERTISFTKAEVDAFTGSGTGDTEKAQNAVEQAVVDYLETLNPSSTITIN